MPTIQSKKNLHDSFDIKTPNYNTTTFVALTDMEQSKGKGIKGKSVKNILQDLKNIKY